HRRSRGRGARCDRGEAPERRLAQPALKPGQAGTPRMAMPRNRVVRGRRSRGPHEMEGGDAPPPTPRPRDARVRVLASSIEYTDIVIRRHLSRGSAAVRPSCRATTSSGKSISSDGVTGFQLGDRVADMTVVGSNAAYRTLRADRLTPVPAGLD